METVRELLRKFHPDTWVVLKDTSNPLFQFTDTNGRARVSLDEDILNSNVSKWEWKPELNETGTLEIKL